MTSVSPLAIAATGLERSMEDMARIANNLSNTKSVAFKAQISNTTDLPYIQVKSPGIMTSESIETPTGKEFGCGTTLNAIIRDYSNGAYKSTGRALDWSISGVGYFVIEANGQKIFTRKGDFVIGKDRKIQTTDGYPIDGLAEIPADVKDTTVAISAEGVVTYRSNTGDPVEIGRLQLAIFNNEQGLKAMGNGIYFATNASGEATFSDPGLTSVGTISQNSLEESNVDAPTEFTNLIDNNRLYSLCIKIYETVQEMDKKLTA